MTWKLPTRSSVEALGLCSTAGAVPARDLGRGERGTPLLARIAGPRLAGLCEGGCTNSPGARSQSSRPTPGSVPSSTGLVLSRYGHGPVRSLQVPVEVQKPQRPQSWPVLNFVVHPPAPSQATLVHWLE